MIKSENGKVEVTGDSLELRCDLSLIIDALLQDKDFKPADILAEIESDIKFSQAARKVWEDIDKICDNAEKSLHMQKLALNFLKEIKEEEENE